MRWLVLGLLVLLALGCWPGLTLPEAQRLCVQACEPDAGRVRARYVMWEGARCTCYNPERGHYLYPAVVHP